MSVFFPISGVEVVEIKGGCRGFKEVEPSTAIVGKVLPEYMGVGIGVGEKPAHAFSIKPAVDHGVILATATGRWVGW